MSKEINVNRYNRQYGSDIPYRYKVNTRYLRHFIVLLEKHINSEDIHRVLDIGCGNGILTALLAQDYPRAAVEGWDISEVGIAAAKSACGAIQNLDFACCDVTQCESEKKYQLICAFEVLEHIDEWKTLLEKMIGLNEGYMIISAPVGRMRNYEIAHGHVRNFKKGEIEDFLSSKGYGAVKCYYAGFPFWSPITRDLLNLFPQNESNVQGEKLSIARKGISLLLYFLFRFCSFKNKGDMFVGLFKKVS